MSQQVQPSNPPTVKTLSDRQVEFLKLEYTALREEVVQRVSMNQQLILATLLGAGTFFSVALQYRTAAVILTIYPLLVTFIAAMLSVATQKSPLVAIVRLLVRGQMGQFLLPEEQVLPVSARPSRGRGLGNRRQVLHEWGPLAGHQWGFLHGHVQMWAHHNARIRQISAYITGIEEALGESSWIGWEHSGPQVKLIKWTGASWLSLFAVRGIIAGSQAAAIVVYVFSTGVHSSNVASLVLDLFFFLLTLFILRHHDTRLETMPLRDKWLR